LVGGRVTAPTDGALTHAWPFPSDAPWSLRRLSLAYDEWALSKTAGDKERAAEPSGTRPRERGCAAKTPAAADSLGGVPPRVRPAAGTTAASPAAERARPRRSARIAARAPAGRRRIGESATLANRDQGIPRGGWA
jgi:hypothetical protein